MVFHWPIIQTTAAAIGALLMVVAAEAPAGLHLGAPELLAFVAGLLYTQLFEHAAHRFPMHRRIRFLEGVRMNHLKHHRLFNGARFETRRTEDAAHIPGRWWIFPVLLAAHYAALAPVLADSALVGFLAAATLHYVVFEVSHWFTHIEDNAFDRALETVPFLGALRARQIEHHRLHHEVPEIAFNFNPPYLGDRLTRRMPRHAAGLGFRFPPLPEPASASASAMLLPGAVTAPLASARAALGFWQRPAVRTASAVAAGVVGVAVIGAAFFLVRSGSAGRQLGLARQLTAQNPS